MSSERAMERVMTEQRAGRHLSDVVASNGAQSLALLEKGAGEKYKLPLGPSGEAEGSGICIAANQVFS